MKNDAIKGAKKLFVQGRHRLMTLTRVLSFLVCQQKAQKELKVLLIQFLNL